jgi:DNA-binding transcriptional MerR regulator
MRDAATGRPASRIVDEAGQAAGRPAGPDAPAAEGRGDGGGGGAAGEARDAPVEAARAAGTGRIAGRIAPKEYYSIGEVCEITDLKPHVLRYWESQFRILNPSKNRAGNRAYRRKDIQLIQLVKHLLYTEKFTIEGARQKLEEIRRGRDAGVTLPTAEERRADLLTSMLRDLEALNRVIEEHHARRPARPRGKRAGSG